MAPTSSVPGGGDSQPQGPKPLSNRRGFGSKCEPTGLAVGVDRLSLSFPIAPNPDPDFFNTHTLRRAGDRHSWSGSTQIQLAKGASVYFGAMEVQEDTWWGKVEWNPSRIEDPGGCSLADVASTRSSAGAVWGMVHTLMGPQCDLEEARVKRIDLARDFAGVTQPAYLLAGLAKERRPHARRTGVWSAHDRGGAATLHAGSNAGMVRLYDQHEAYAEKGAAAGSMRVEAQFGTGWLGGSTPTTGKARPELKILAELASDRCREMFRERYDWSRFGVPVAGTDAVNTRAMQLVAEGRYSAAEMRGCLAEMYLRASGHVSMTSKATAAKFNRFIRDLGVTLPAGDQLDSGMTVRLDLEAGTEVLEMAS